MSLHMRNDTEDGTAERQPSPWLAHVALLAIVSLLGACGGSTTFDANPPGEGEGEGEGEPEYTAPEIDEELGFSCDTGEVEPFPGYPFDTTVYEQEVQPLWDGAGCSAGSCHGPDTAAGGLLLNPAPAPRSAEFFQNLCSVKTKINWEDPANSLILTEPLDVGGTPHPIKVWENTDDVVYQSLLTLITNAKRLRDGGGGSVVQPPVVPDDNSRPLPPVTTSPFDFNAFQTTIQPIFDDPANSCSNQICHGEATNAKLVIHANPTPGSEEMKRNFFNVTDPRFTEFASIEQSLILTKPSGSNHTGGAQFQANDANWTAIRDWIAAARANLPDDQRDEGTQDPRVYDEERFANDIMPQLNAGTTYNCAASVCHGSVDANGDPLGSGRLFLWNNPAPGSTELSENYASVAAFLSLENPTQSSFLTEPRGINHTGGIQFENEQDLLYLTILDWILQARGFTHLDEVYFTLRVADAFYDPAALGEENDLITTCASSQCHGTNNTGVPPGNRSNFALLANPVEPAHYAFNFNSASNFVNRATPLNSSILLYPLSVDMGGVPHPGGNNFIEEDLYYAYMTRWLEGLKPVEGYLREWLVVGPIEAAPGNNDLEYLADEANLELNYGAYIGDTDFSAEAIIMDEANTIDLANYFGGETDNKVAYAMTYVFANGDGMYDLDFTHDDAVKAWVGNLDGPMTEVYSNIEPGTGTATVELKGGLNRVMLKVLNLEGDWNFSVQVKKNGQPALDLVVKLGSAGGVALAVAPDAGPQYDYEVLYNDTFKNVVIPAIEAGGCADGGPGTCHANGSGGFTFNDGANNEAAYRANFDSVGRNPRVRLGPDNYLTSRLINAPFGASHSDRNIGWNGPNDNNVTQIKAWILEGVNAQE